MVHSITAGSEEGMDAGQGECSCCVSYDGPYSSIITMSKREFLSHPPPRLVQADVDESYLSQGLLRPLYGT